MKPENSLPVDHGVFKETHAFLEAQGRKKQKGNWEKSQPKPMPEVEFKFTSNCVGVTGDKLTQRTFETLGFCQNQSQGHFHN